MGEIGYIKLHRKLLDNPIVTKDADHLAVWIWLLLHATWDEASVSFRGKRLTLRPGQLTTGRREIAADLRVTESKIQRILKEFETEHQIEQQTDYHCRLITIVSWDKYQLGEQPNEHQMNSYRTANEQLMNTNKEIKNIRNKESYLSYRGSGSGKVYVDPDTGRIRFDTGRRGDDA